jgi:hypothetical protein
MRASETCTRILSIRRVVAVALVMFMIATMSAFYQSAPLRSKTKETIEQISHSVHSMHSSLVDITTSRSSRPTLDIVISMYKENVTEVARQLDDLLALNPVRDLDVNTVIYVKDPEANLEAVKAHTGANDVVHLSNIGREGGTFLTHIIMNWDFLARHTMFVQAGMHAFGEAENRITDYFIPRTGILPLGTLELCECLACKDPWDGERTFPRLPQLYSALNGRLCPKYVTLSYLGQMLVSAKRIQSRPQEIYEHLRAVLESGMQHFIHDDPRQDWVFRDDPSEPYFGHTMERSWMMLWGCEDMRIMHTCAGWEGLINRRVKGDKDNKCQCLDQADSSSWF